MPTKSVNGTELYFEATGTGTPIIFLHGVMMGSRFFTEQSSLADEYQTIFLDFRGHGRSEKPETGHTLPTYARDLEAFLDNQGVDDVIIVGWSMGSLVTWEYISQFGTDRIRGFVTVEQQPLDLKQEGYEHGVFDFEELRDLMELAQSDPNALADSFIEQMLVKDPGTDLEKRLFDEISRVPPGIKSAILFDQSVRDYRPVLDQVDVPTLVCVGEDETLLETAGVEYIAEHTPDAELEWFTTSSHCPFLEEPKRFNSVLSEFIEGL